MIKRSIVILILSLLSVFEASAAYWKGDQITYILPAYTSIFKNELKAKIDAHGNLAVSVPQKNADYWLAPEDDKVHDRIGKLIASGSYKKYKELMKAVKKGYPHLAALYESKANLNDPQTLENHTLAVLKQFEKQHGFYNLNAPAYAKITQNMKKVFVGAILVHDIGKPLGERTKQHEFTAPIAKKALKLWGFSESESKLALALIDNDVIGELVQPRYKQSPVQAVVDLAKIAAKVGLSLQAFFRLQVLFYVSDASSYPFIRSIAFKESKNKQLFPVSKKFIKLKLMVYDGKLPKEMIYEPSFSDKVVNTVISVGSKVSKIVNNQA